MSGASQLQVEYCPGQELQSRAADWWRDVLAVVRFEQRTARSPLEVIPTAEVSASVLGGAGSGSSSAEVWRLSGPMSSGQRGRLRYRRNGQLLFAAVAVSEADFEATGGAATVLRAATQAAYGELFEGIEHLGFPHPLRIWNFLPEINGSVGGGERYWHFNSARQSAFLGARRSIQGNVPAASAVGSEAGTTLTIYCIAGRTPPIAVENPRQCSAWAYPPQYGPKSPTFARACIEPGEGAQTLFISGTASIVGHETAHPGDAAAQTREALRNVQALIKAANERLGVARYSVERLRYKAYVRRPQDQPHVEQLLRQEAGITTPVLYLKADLCRRDLLVELEASGTCGDG